MPSISKGMMAYLISIIALGCAEYYELQALWRLSLPMSIITAVILIIILVLYVCKMKKDVNNVFSIFSGKYFYQNKRMASGEFVVKIRKTKEDEMRETIEIILPKDIVN